MSILSAIPLEVFTGTITGILGFLGSVYAAKQKAKNAEQKQLISRHTADEASRARAEEGGTASSQKEKQWTRRTIAITATMSILLIPIVAGMLGVHVTTGWTEISGGFWPFTDSSGHMVWHQVKGGIVITPLHTHTLSSIIGFYFGSSIAENARN